MKRSSAWWYVINSNAMLKLRMRSVELAITHIFLAEGRKNLAQAKRSAGLGLMISVYP